MKKKSGYFMRAILSVVVLTRLLPAVERIEPKWQTLENNPASGLGIVMWGLQLIVSLSIVVVMLQNIFRFLAEVKREKSAGDESATKAVELALKRIQLVMFTIYQVMFGMAFVGIGCVVIFAPRERIIGGDSPVPAGVVCMALGGLWVGFSVWKAIKKWKADKNEGMNQWRKY